MKTSIKTAIVINKKAASVSQMYVQCVMDASCVPYVFMNPSLASPAAVFVVDEEYGATELLRHTSLISWAVSLTSCVEGGNHCRGEGKPKST